MPMEMIAMDIQIDSREKPEAIKQILAEFDRAKVHYFKSKLYVGDYQNLDNPYDHFNYFMPVPWTDLYDRLDEIKCICRWNGFPDWAVQPHVL